jgi:hypothetical protein
MNTNRNLVLAPLIAVLGLAGGAVHAASPQPLYGTFTNVYGTSAALATTSGSGLDNRSGYVVAAIADSAGGLEVKAWQDTTLKLVDVGHVHAESNTIVTAAAAGIDSAHVVTADVDVNGVLSLRTWTLGGSAGIAELNHYGSDENTANPLAFNPSLGMVDLTATQVVTAYEDAQQNLTLQAWTVSDTSAKPAKLGSAAVGGSVIQISIAAIDSATVMTAVIIEDPVTDSDDLQVTTWGVDSTGVHQQDQMTLKGVVDGSYPSVAIDATTAMTVSPAGQFPAFKYTRYASTPIISPDSNTVEVYDWQISSAGKISKTGGPYLGSAPIGVAVGGCMLQTGVPMTVYANLTGPKTANYVTVGWFERNLDSEFDAIDGLGASVDSVVATTAGTSFNAVDPYKAVNAYFFTGALTSTGGLSPSPTNPGVFKLQIWSYPITLPLL